MADRWHLCKNLREEVETVVLHERQALPVTISHAPTQDPHSAPCSAPVVTLEGVEPTDRDAADALIRASVRHVLY